MKMSPQTESVVEASPQDMVPPVRGVLLEISYRVDVGQRLGVVVWNWSPEASPLVGKLRDMEGTVCCTPT